MESDDNNEDEMKNESPQYMSPSEDSDVEYLESTQSKVNRQNRVSRSVELNTNLAERALRTFLMSDPIKNREQGPLTSQASRITDSTQATDTKKNIRLTKEKNQAKQKPAMSATKTNLDADHGDVATKPLTRARAKILASQDSQANNENHSLATNTEYEIIPSHAPAISGSRLTIKRIKD